MSAGTGTAAFSSGAELEAAMTAAFGPDFRDLVFVGTLEPFRFEAVFEECGLEDPRRPVSSGSYGLWQCMPSGGYIPGAATCR